MGRSGSFADRSKHSVGRAGAREVHLAISEDVCWRILRLAQGKSVATKWLKGEQSVEPALQNAIPLSVLEHDLVLRHTKAQIEDSLCFLEKRGYLIRHGFQGLTRVAFQLSEKALTALRVEAFSAEEQGAFREALLDIKQPALWGMRLNLGETWRRLKRRFR